MTPLSAPCACRCARGCHTYTGGGNVGRCLSDRCQTAERANGTGCKSFTKATAEEVDDK